MQDRDVVTRDLKQNKVILYTYELSNTAIYDDLQSPSRSFSYLRSNVRLNSASEITTIWRYTNVYIIIIIIIILCFTRATLYASAVFAVIVCPSVRLFVCLCVTSWSSL